MNNAITLAKANLTTAQFALGRALSAEAAAAADASRDEKYGAAQAAELEVMKSRQAVDILVGSEAKSQGEHDDAVEIAVQSQGRIARAGIEFAFAATRASRSQKAHVAAVEALNVARRELRAAAVAVADAEDMQLAERCEAAREVYVSLAGQLNSRVTSDLTVPLNQHGRKLPPIVSKALENAPRPDPFHTPLSLLHGQATLNDWNARIAALMTGQRQAV